jgi:rubrerythrin
MSVNKEAIVAGLYALRAQTDSLLLLMGEGGCEHTRKEDLGSFGEGEHWVCRDCGFEHRGPANG